MTQDQPTADSTATAAPALRDATPADIDGWLALRLAMFPHHPVEFLRDELMALLDDPERHGAFLAFDDDGALLGFAEVALRTDYVPGMRTSPVAFLEAIHVAPAARRRGIARALVMRAHAWGRARGCSEFASDALLDNDASHAMHRALGFVETRRVVFFRRDIDG